MRKLFTLAALAAIVLMVAPAQAQLTPMEQLGKFLYFDTNLSTPSGQSCASCHLPEAGFADPDQGLPVSEGIIPTRFGNRNAPGAAYAAFSPLFGWNEAEGLYMGGQFWDGRAADLTEQAKGPFLNPLEMNMPNKKSVVKTVSKSDYANLFLDVYGPGAFDDVELAYHNIAAAIAAFESSSEVNPFSSKYDLYLAGEVELTPQEQFGLEVYEGKAMCNLCHPSEGAGALFTDYSYDNLGVPRNPNNPFYGLPPHFNPDGENFVDLGLGGFLNDPAEMGKVKVPTLRNIALTAPYMHNGFFGNLRDVVRFYSTRDVDPTWPPPEYADNVNVDELGNLGLTDEEIDAVVAFMMTLTDGYQPMMAKAVPGEQAPPVKVATLSAAPNPFNPATTVRFELPYAGAVRITAYDVAGRLVGTLLNEPNHPAGFHQVTWTAEGLASGSYFLRLHGPGTDLVQKVTLVK